jgi:hypothetical protein
MMTTEPCSETWCWGQFTSLLIIIKRYSNLRNWSNMIVWTLDWRHFFPLLSLLYMICIYYTCIYMWYSLINHDKPWSNASARASNPTSLRHFPPRSTGSTQLSATLTSAGCERRLRPVRRRVSWLVLTIFVDISHIFTHFHTFTLPQSWIKSNKVGRFI